MIFFSIQFGLGVGASVIVSWVWRRYVLLTFKKSLDETRLDLSQFLEDMYIIRAFLHTVYACSYWTCCMLTITFERTGDEDQEPFLTWGGDPSQLDTRNAAIKSYKRLIASFFQQNKMFANERLIDHLNYIRQAIPQLNEITRQMRAVYYSYRDYKFFPINMAWFPSIILVEEDSQDAAILCLGPAGSSRACQCFSSLMNSARTKLFVNVSRITKDKEFGQPSILTTLCGRSIGVEASMQLFGRSVHLSLILQARSIKNAFKNCYLETINRFNQRDESSFFHLLSSTNLKEQFLEGIILAVLVKLSSVDKNDRSCRLVSEMLESSNQVAKDATEGHTHSSIALASLLIIRDACSEVALRTMCCWKFNFEEQSLRIEVGSFIAIAHNLEVSPSMNWLTFLACDDSYLIKCLQSVALSPRTLEDSWNHQAHSMFSHNLASLIGRSLSIRNSSSVQISSWIDAISAANGFGIIISESNKFGTFPACKFLANVLKVGSVFWWASKNLNNPSEIPNTLSSSSVLMNFDVLEHQEASSQLSFIYRTFRIIPPQLSIISAAKEMPAEYAPLLQSFGKIGLKVIS